MPKCDFNKEITLRHGCSPVSLLHICRTPFLKYTLGWLLLLSVNCLVKSSITDIGQGSKIRLSIMKTVSVACFSCISLKTNYLLFDTNLHNCLVWIFYWNLQINLKNLPRIGVVIQRCSVKKLFLENWQNPQENTCATVSFLIKFQDSGLQLYLKETLVQVFSSEIYEILKNTFLHRTFFTWEKSRKYKGISSYFWGASVDNKQEF